MRNNDGLQRIQTLVELIIKRNVCIALSRLAAYSDLCSESFSKGHHKYSSSESLHLLRAQPNVRSFAVDRGRDWHRLSSPHDRDHRPLRSRSLTSLLVSTKQVLCQNQVHQVRPDPVLHTQHRCKSRSLRFLIVFISWMAPNHVAWVPAGTRHVTLS